MTSSAIANADTFSVPVNSLSTLVQLLRWRAVNQPKQSAYIFLPDGEIEGESFTYADLDKRARAIAAALQSAVANEERALLLFPSGSDFVAAFFGCLYAGVIAVPVYPPDPARLNRTLPRFRAVAHDARPAVALTTSALLPMVEHLAAQSPDLRSIRWLTTDNVGDRREQEWKEPALSRSAVAFLQYTSGSTSAPKGVMVTHGNLLHNERVIKEACGHSEQSTFVSWLPLYHDMGLIGTLLQPLYLGALGVIMPPTAFLQTPFRWLQAISRYKAATSGGPNFAYDLCVRKITAEQRATLDLSSWTTAFNGAEPVRHETVERFASAFADCGFRREAFFPCYGLAESTLIVSGSSRKIPFATRAVQSAELERNRAVQAADDEIAQRIIVSCGEPLSGQQVIIVNPEDLTQCPPGIVGEIWVSGPSVARGYWNRPEETQQTFNAYLAATGEGPFLRTGDLGFVIDGELFVTGRLKSLIIIRGRNHYPQDIEMTVEGCHKRLRTGCGAAFSVEAAGEERLVIVQEVDDKKQTDTDEIIRAIRREVAEDHQLQTHSIVLIKPGSIPKTSSGKIQRHACREAFLEKALETIECWQESLDWQPQSQSSASIQPENSKSIEAWLVSRLAAKLRIDANSIAIDEPILNYGLDSLIAIELMHDIETHLGAVMPATSLLQNLTVTQVAEQAFFRMTTSDTKAARELAQTEKRSSQQALSYGQQALWFMHKLAPESAAYNVAAAARILAELDVQALKRAFQSLVDRHPSLRTVFYVTNGEPVQRINERLDICFQQTDASILSDAIIDERMVEEAHRPFDLEQGPLLRITLLRRSSREHILLLVAHHIVVDFWSLGVMLQELGILYESAKSGSAASLAPLTHSYADYARWQAGMLTGAEGERLRAYWLKQLGDGLPTLELPTDRPRPTVQTYAGASQSFKLDREITDNLKALARNGNATLYAVLLASFQMLLHRYTDAKDIRVGSPTAGRTRAEFRNLVGYFVNPVILRADFSADPTFDEFLDSVRQTVLSALNYQDYPFNLLVGQLQPERDPGRPSLFQVMFVLQKTPLFDEQELAAFALGEAGAKIKLGSLCLESMPLQQRVAQFDLTLAMAETDGGLAGSFEYNTDLFDAATISRLSENFKCLLNAVVIGPRERISKLAALSEAEQSLLIEWNQTHADYPNDQSIQQVFEAQAESSPDAVAVIFEDIRLTYAELNRRANQLAHRLRALGVGPETSVGVCIERSQELAVALLAVLKAGGIYAQLDPQYPKERLAFMMEDSRAQVLITESKLATRLPMDALPADIIRFDTDWDLIAKQSDANPQNQTEPDNLAYIIYTSGSTGRPKGVCVSHRVAVEHFFVAQKQYGLRASDVVLQFASFSFDVSLEQILPPLLIGASVVIRGEEIWSPAAFINKVSDLGITVINPATAYWHQLVKDFAANEEKLINNRLRLVIVGGDAMLPESVRLWQQSQLSSVRLLNAYGPTEATITTTVFEAPPGFCDQSSLRRMPIGRPLENRTMLILNRKGELAPIGVAGELHIGGSLLARGYLGRPELTSERFIPDGFSNEPGSRLYKTGDLARYLADGNIEFLGRMDYQVKVRGFRIELGEVEAALACHADVRECVVEAREDAGGDKRLVAYAVAYENRTITANHLRDFLKQRLPDYMVPAVVVLLEKLPLTPNGKIDRRKLPPPPDEGRSSLAESFIAPRTPIEELLAGICAEVLRVERIGVHDNFFEMGGHSLLATKVVSRILDALRIELPVSSVFEAPTVEGLAEKIEALMRAGQPARLHALKRIPRNGSLPLSFAQQRLWLLDQLGPGSAAYNIPFIIRLKGRADRDALERSISEIIARHEALRAVFITVEGRPRQIITPASPAQMPFVDLTYLPEHEREGEATRMARVESRQPFDLAHGPLLRAKLLWLGGEDYMVVIITHHIASDGWSAGIFARELATLYQCFSEGGSPSLTDLPIQYADFAHWQQEWLSGEVLDAQLEYWKRQLAAAPPVLELPADRKRPAAQTFEGSVESFNLSARLNEQLKELSRANGVTLFMTLMAAFNTLLYRYARQHDIIVGTPIANRSLIEVEPLIGFFSNMLALRTDMSGNPDFANLLKRVRDAALGAYAHQDLPIEKLVEELRPDRSLSHAPLFQVVLTLHDDPLRSIEIPGLTLSQVLIHNRTAKFDLLMNLWEREDCLIGALEYSTDLFEAPTIKRMVGSFTTLLEAIVTDPNTPVLDLPLLTDSERRQLLEWNDAATRYSHDFCVHQLFESQVERAPQAMAIVFEQDSLTYHELNRRANQLAHHLRNLGVEPESRVAICLDRSMEMLIAILAVLKAGGAYVPLDPAYPKERLACMIEDARAPALVTQSAMAERLPATASAIVELDTSREAIAQQSEANLDSQSSAETPAYVIYTSGSTGKPKGVIVTHANVTRLFEATRRWFEFDEKDVWTLFHSYAFDFSVWEMWGALLYGGRLVVVPYMLSRAPEAFYDLLVKEQVTVLNQTPSAFRQLMRVEESLDRQKRLALSVVIFGGEALELQSLKRWFERHGDQEPLMVNMYGITETTVHVTYRPIKESDLAGSAGSVIGGPILDLQILVLDERLQPAPVGVAGEIYVGGEGIARGYLNQAALTAQRFIPNPHSKYEGARLYKTGDLARYLANGELEYMGRADQQVKVRGYRIELGEIEAAMMEHSAIRESIVIAREEADHERRLIGYLVAEEEGKLTTGELRAYLKEKLPDHMVPAVFVMMNAFPMTANGKIDRRALPAPESQRPALGSLCIEPRTEMEKIIATVWQQVLRIEQAGVHDNFFDLGGDSFLLAQACSKLREALNRDISMVEAFTYTSINSLATYLSSAEVESRVRRQSSAEVETRKQSMKQREQMRKQLRAKSKP